MLPLEVLGRLRKAVVAARHYEIVEIIEAIRDTEPDVAKGLRRMASLFDYEWTRDFPERRSRRNPCVTAALLTPIALASSALFP